MSNFMKNDFFAILDFDDNGYGIKEMSSILKICGTKGKYFNIYMLFIAYSNIMNLMFVSTKIYMLKLILNVRVFGREAFGGH
jgi:hypothetical protein